uniref:Uncharacterized protein n=1 Tax=Octopus bimaculoides TaxID=37653 RepID=A0A0L8GR38_OCTBM
MDALIRGGSAIFIEYLVESPSYYLPFKGLTAIETASVIFVYLVYFALLVALVRLGFRSLLFLTLLLLLDSCLEFAERSVCPTLPVTYFAFLTQSNPERDENRMCSVLEYINRRISVKHILKWIMDQCEDFEVKNRLLLAIDSI